MNRDSILDSVKKQVGILGEDNSFDDELIQHTNSAFFILNQLGVGPEEPFTIYDRNAYWDDFVCDGVLDIVKSYVPLRVRLLFDPPTNSYLVDNINKQISDFEFRMMVEAERQYLPEPDMSGIYVTEEVADD